MAVVGVGLLAKRINSMRVTMRDVARAAGVSVTTVSYVLTRRKDVTISPATRERVVREARRLNYQHNAIAADLRRGATRLVSIQLYSLAVPILARKVSALERELRSAGFYPFLCHVLDPDAERTFFSECASRRVRGLVLTAPPAPDARDCIRQLQAHRIPVVSTEPVPELGVPFVTVDRREGARTAARHLLSLGHRRIAAVVGYTGRAASDFVDGYRQSLAAAGIAASPGLVVHASREDSWYGAGGRAVDTLLALAEPPTAIMTTDDAMAIGAIRRLQERGLRVPDDVAVVGCDDDPAAAYTDIPLTTLAQPAEEVGVRLAALFLEAAADPEAIAGQGTRLPLQLVVRESCGAAGRAIHLPGRVSPSDGGMPSSTQAATAAN